MGSNEQTIRGTQNSWICMNVEASGVEHQGHATIGAFKSQSSMGYSSINIQTVGAQTNMGGVSLNVGEILTNATSQQIGSSSQATRRGSSLGVRPPRSGIFKTPGEREKCQARRGGRGSI
ncbi:hypothetical protein QJS04_geneDACA015631 [Acorus gramineus]|uniref:Uncharacterized protein n=1 Tax=Acorus gramineus TaxID=55184 RepID=A0AAV9AQM1_ACOGR|nr:hypothetical protein QJS04_geneDACA015631 [Acorus gramineus]